MPTMNDLNGDGQSFETAYEITSLAELRLISGSENENNPNLHFKLVNDIGSPEQFQDGGEFWNGGDGWRRMLADSFTGYLWGNGFKIRNVMISNPGSSQYGLFGQWAGKARDIWMTDVDMSFDGSNVGGFAGRFLENAEVDGFIISGSITNTDLHTAGLVGYISSGQPNIIIRNCKILADIHGEGTYVAGVCSRSLDGTTLIDKCVTIGNITGDGDVNRTAAIAGRMVSSSQVTNSFFDSAVNSQGENSGATGVSEAALKDILTYTDDATEGLDVGGEYDMVLLSAHNGEKEPNLWGIDDGEDYPKLWFEIEAPTSPSGTITVEGIEGEEPVEGAHVIILEADDEDFTNVTLVTVLTSGADGTYTLPELDFNEEKVYFIAVHYKDEFGNRYSDISKFTNV
jgi:hypothetical protein